MQIIAVLLTVLVIINFLLVNLPSSDLNSITWQLQVTLGDDNWDGNENGKNFASEKYNFARASRFLPISSLSLNDYDVKVPNLMFFVGHEHNTTAFFVFSRTSIQSFRIQLQKNLLSTFDELNEME